VEGISGKQLDVEINARIFSPKGELVTETKGFFAGRSTDSYHIICVIS